MKNIIIILSLCFLFSCEDYYQFFPDHKIGTRPNSQVLNLINNPSLADMNNIPTAEQVNVKIDSFLLPPACPDNQPTFKVKEVDSKPLLPQIQTEKLGQELSLWATNYYTPQIKNNGKYPLKDMNDNIHKYNNEAAMIEYKHWCYAAMEGSVRVSYSDGNKKTYNYAGIKSFQLDCSKYFKGKYEATNRVRFIEVKSKWGKGVKKYNLIPYRTIAVDPTIIPYGSVVFIPEAKGQLITLTDGTTYSHDGYFFAGDTGGAIKKSHIDVFTGSDKQSIFDFVQSTPSRKFKAYIVDDKKIIDPLTQMHTLPITEI